MVSGHNLDVLDHLDEFFKEFWDVLPFFQLDLSNCMLHIAQKDQLLWMSVFQELSKLVEESGNLGRDVYSLAC